MFRRFAFLFFYAVSLGLIICLTGIPLVPGLNTGTQTAAAQSVLPEPGLPEPRPLNPGPPEPGPVTSVPVSAAQVKLSFSPIVKATSPAVVNVYTKTLVHQRRSLFDEMFGNDFFSPPSQRRRIQNSLGSGVLIAEDGLVVTNSHVIKGASEIRVVTADKREFAARVVLEVEDTDLAFLKLTDAAGARFPTLDLADTDTLEVGDLVLAIGNPFGVGQTVTSGIVSAVGRGGVEARDSANLFIQTDAAINPGNSGGALVDMNGALVGINTAIFSRSGGSNGIGFAIPSNLVQVYLRDVERGSASAAPWIGVKGQDLSRELSEGLGLDNPSGVIIREVFPGGPGDKAGMKAGDVVVAVNGVGISDNRSMAYRLRLADPDLPVLIELKNSEGLRTVALQAVEPPETPPANETLIKGVNPLSGAVLSNLSPKTAREKGLRAVWTGVVVDRVYRNSWAARYGFRKNDRILSVNGRVIETLEDLDPEQFSRAPRWIIKKTDAEGRTSTLRLSR